MDIKNAKIYTQNIVIVRAGEITTVVKTRSISAESKSPKTKAKLGIAIKFARRFN